MKLTNTLTNLMFVMVFALASYLPPLEKDKAKATQRAATQKPVVVTGNCWFDEDGNAICAPDEQPAPDCSNDPNLCQ